MITRYFVFCLSLFFWHSCKKLESVQLYKSIHPFIFNDVSLDFSGEIVALGDNDCHSCSSYLMNSSLNNIDSFYIFKKCTFSENNNVMSKVIICQDNDKLARVLIDGIYGHRIYSVRKSRVVSVVKINIKNIENLGSLVDSLRQKFPLK